MTSERAYGTPAALEQALGARIRERYPAEEFQARKSEVAYRRLVARMFATSPDEWVLKGGYAMILRLDPNRTSNDIDVSYVNAAGNTPWHSGRSSGRPSMTSTTSSASR